LAKGDKVVSIGGICGTIAQLGEEEVVVKIDGDLKMTFLRSAIRTQETIGEKK
jgi:preprotein translocase subunit YajC